MNTKHPQITMSNCESSQIAAHGYDAETKTMAIQFHRTGGVYHYHDVSPDNYADFKKAESLGKYFGSKIRNTFKFTKIGGAK